jgi:hypothetical protein
MRKEGNHGPLRGKWQNASPGALTGGDSFTIRIDIRCLTKKGKFRTGVIFNS